MGPAHYSAHLPPSVSRDEVRDLSLGLQATGMSYLLSFLVGLVCGWLCSHLHLPIRLEMKVPLTQERVTNLIGEERRQTGR
jgi:hypothetical protein